MGSAKKLLTFTLALLMVLSLAGCGNSRPEPADIDEQPEFLIKTDRIFPLEAGYMINGISYCDNILLVSSSKKEEQNLSLLAVEKQGDNGFELKFQQSLPIPSMPYFNGIKALLASNENSFYVLTGENPAQYYNNTEIVDNPDYQGRYSLLEYSLNGELIRDIEINGWPYGRIRGITLHGDEIYLYDNSYIAKVGETGTAEWSMDFEEPMALSTATSAGGKIILSFFDRATNEPSYFTLDVDNSLTQELNIEVPLDNPQFSLGNMPVCQGLGDEYLICDAFEFCTYNVAENKGEKILTWGYMNDLNRDFGYVCRIDENNFFCVEEDRDYITIISKVPCSGIEPETVKVFVFGDRADDMMGRIKAFDASCAEYNYEMRCFTSEEEKIFLSELNSGNVPDLVVFDADVNTNSNLFDDLYTYIDSDPVLSRESFIPNFLEALEVKGELHELWTGMRLHTVETSSSILENYQILNMEDCKKISEELKIPVFPAYINIPGYVAQFGCTEFIDIKNCESRFDSPEFRALLSLCEDDGNVYGTKSIETEAILTPRDYPAIIILHEHLDRAKGSRVITGLPGSLSGGNYFTPGAAGRGVAIPRDGDNKEGAWAYIRSQLSLSAQMEQDKNFPVILAAAERQGAMYMSDENYEQLVSLLKNTDKAMRYGSNAALIDAIYECANAYAAGDKSLDEAIELIQSRGEIFVSEQYG